MNQIFIIFAYLSRLLTYNDDKAQELIIEPDQFHGSMSRGHQWYNKTLSVLIWCLNRALKYFKIGKCD